MKKQPKVTKETIPPAKAASEVASPITDNVAESPGIFRFTLPVLILVVLAINAAYMAGHFMPNHDTRLMLGCFDYYYSSLRFTGQFAHWMVYGVYGLDAAPCYVMFSSAPNYLVMMLGKVAGAQDSLQLFCISVCLEELLLLLGAYLLCRQLFQNRLVVFCVCLTLVCTASWQSQISVNLRLYSLLPLIFYFLLRLKQEGKGCFGWLAGVAAILGPLGSAAYFYPYWGLLIVIFSVALFWGNFRGLLVMLRPTLANIASALVFAAFVLWFVGMLHTSLTNVTFTSPDRESEAGGVSLASFLTYGGNALSEMWHMLLLPGANVNDGSGHMGMTDYIGLMGLFCLPFIFRRFQSRPVRTFAILLVAVLAISRGGLVATFAYFFPGMHLFRHIGYVTGLMKLLVVILAGYGLDYLLVALKERSLIRNPSRTMLVLASAAVLLYLDMYVGGPTWATLFGFQPPPSPDYLPPAPGDIVYPLLRALLLFAFVFTAWRAHRPEWSNARGPAQIAIGLLVTCIVGDCLLFQLETRHRLNITPSAISYPALPFDSVYQRSDSFAPSIVPKIQAWETAHGADNQIPMSATFQWDPLLPEVRNEWFPRNVHKVAQAMVPANTNEFRVICGDKFRIVPEAVPAASDDAALAMLASQQGWERRVILNGADIQPATGVSSDGVGSSVALSAFSANSVALTVTNTSTHHAWVIYADAYTPDWHARVNGQPAPVLKAYTAFKAVRVDPGASTVEFYYDAGLRSLCLTAFLMGGALAVAAGLAWLLWIAIKESLQR